MKLLKFPTKDEIEDEMILTRQSLMLEVLDTMKEMVMTGEITEFVAASVDYNGEPQIHLCANDTIGGIGLFEYGKHILINF